MKKFLFLIPTGFKNLIFGLILFSFKAKKIDKFSFSMVIGGALGNFYDRLIFNAVPDFIDLHYENYHWFTFNLADIFITIGVLLLILKTKHTINT